LVLNGNALGSRIPSQDMAESLEGRTWSIRLALVAPENSPRIEVPKDSVFLLGDNRYASRDSRNYGPVLISSLRGRAMRIHWSSETHDDTRGSHVLWKRIGLPIQPADEAGHSR